ncbi:hypothetical protein PHYBLDRAFT_141574 [Phycomyces blakesleeanus NRRL 1555(-)]|uniref:Uncharacterized protein n=1 Tax=Phycomyces blakesleeanus (strain ATCC 8743b / DSM 1359 / FGSC 10004 / NBRC 33097 / NRRL 1555) TaxID=763407 RepID=A0A167PDG5_PHYB8|nr:hypothetical protein PHYBLDRAFT_141574 [Phycomyces blakesleeanus NRRL 1555(-)]OAD77709.1 hypothetical protein PHYBLDRAFT_141574 [Phycomyces blakesleeanus NRRL 1555(-)]|eukprot:XP_018295749.1 hypothetical protein PHYBLDRAFT_141574 [Phycomyces blakesleeanus NRRL 1555(-)]
MSHVNSTGHSGIGLLLYQEKAYDQHHLATYASASNARINLHKSRILSVGLPSQSLNEHNLQLSFPLSLKAASSDLVMLSRVWLPQRILTAQFADLMIRSGSEVYLSALLSSLMHLTISG